MARIEIDEHSGFCFGVVTAIRKAEEELDRTGRLYCLGDIVHNSNEVERLKAKGLITIDHEQLKQLHVKSKPHTIPTLPERRKSLSTAKPDTPKSTDWWDRPTAKPSSSRETKTSTR